MSRVECRDEKTLRGKRASNQQMSDETINIGREAGTPVTPDYDRHSSVFSGKIDWVQIDLGEDDADPIISPEERLRVVMARQAEKSDEGRVKRNSLTGANRGH